MSICAISISCLSNMSICSMSMSCLSVHTPKCAIVYLVCPICPCGSISISCLSVHTPKCTISIPSLTVQYVHMLYKYILLVCSHAQMRYSISCLSNMSICSISISCLSVHTPKCAISIPTLTSGKLTPCPAQVTPEAYIAM
jgi:hypothetical protein